MRILKPGQEVTLNENPDDPTQTVKGRIRCATIYDDMSVQYICRWWADGEPCEDTFSLSELEETPGAEYIDVGEISEGGA